MKIAVVHLTLNFLGGAEKVCLTAVEALKHAGHKVTLVTIERTDWKSVKTIFGDVTMPDREVYFTTSKLSKQLSNIMISAVSFFAYVNELLSLRSMGRYDLTINTYGDLLNSMTDLVYIHFPLRATLKYSQIPPIMDTAKWGLCFKVYDYIARLFDKVNYSAILTNSKFVRAVIEEFLHRNATVIYPPVDVQIFSTLARNRKRENMVVTISGYSPKRHLERVPLIARYAKSARFAIVGKANEYSLSTHQRLRRIIKELGVKDRVELMTNIPRPALRDLLSRAKVYLHVMPYEHFGTAIVEAMASGCVPVVHRSGGPWLDILDQKQGEYGYAFDFSREAAQYIDMLIGNQTVRKRMALATSERSRLFDKCVFKRKIVNVAETMHAFKGK